jgi:hypothetical protein
VAIDWALRSGLETPQRRTRILEDEVSAAEVITERRHGFEFVGSPQYTGQQVMLSLLSILSTITARYQCDPS